MSLTRDDWKNIFLLQQSRVEAWERIANENDNCLYKTFLNEAMELLEKIEEELSKCKQ